jgi:two-component system, LytTR family, response regulator
MSERSSEVLAGTEARARATRIVIADDEPIARDRVRSMLTGRPEYEIVGEAGDGAQAVELILGTQPDVVFLDVKMPELDGFEVLEALEADGAGAPAIIFVTAFGEYAVKAFEVRALDYLLKPFDRARFDRALEGAAARREVRAADPSAPIDPGLKGFLESLRGERRYPMRFVVRNAHRVHFVKANEIDWVDAAGNYVRLHVSGRAHLVRDTMKSFASRLDPDHFVRVHRSAIVNLDSVAQVEPYVHGEYIITLRDGTRLTSSRAHSARLRELLA